MPCGSEEEATMTTKTLGQVLYEAESARIRWPRNWWQLLESTRALFEADAAAVLAHDRANQPAASGVPADTEDVKANILAMIQQVADQYYQSGYEDGINKVGLA
jgi:hypothetical protein